MKDHGKSSPCGEARPAQTGSAEQGPTDAEEARRRRFAKALARAQFGRHYWDDRLETELRNAMKQKGRKHK